MPSRDVVSRPAIAAALGWLAACGGSGGLPPEVPALVKGPDGKEYHLVVKGAYKAYYDRWGRLERLEHDANGDGRADQVAYHHGSKEPNLRTGGTWLVEVDEDFDGRPDRWEDFERAGGPLVKVGTSRRGQGPDLWTYPGTGDVPSRKDYDDDGDGYVERIEHLAGGRVERVEIDTDRDRRIDRWQAWKGGRLLHEELDTDGDGSPDRRLRYGPKGAIPSVERVAR